MFRLIFTVILVACALAANTASAQSWNDLPPGWSVTKTTHNYPTLVD